MGAVDASGGVAGGAQHLADVSGQQRCLERLGGVSGRDPLEQVRQVYGSVKAVGAGGADPGAQIGVRAGTERVVGEEPYPAPWERGRMRFST